jgi:hypothetical protein
MECSTFIKRDDGYNRLVRCTSYDYCSNIEGGTRSAVTETVNCILSSENGPLLIIAGFTLLSFFNVLDELAQKLKKGAPVNTEAIADMEKEKAAAAMVKAHALAESSAAEAAARVERLKEYEGASRAMSGALAAKASVVAASSAQIKTVTAAVAERRVDPNDGNRSMCHLSIQIVTRITLGCPYV